MFERFTDRARRVLVLAQQEARRLGHREIDVSHLVLGALTTTDGAPGAEDHGVLADVRQLIESSLDADTAKRWRGSAVHIPFTPAAKVTLELGQRLARRAGRNNVVANGLLLAALDQPSVTEPLTAGGIDLDTLRAAARDALPEPTADP